jgi:hypothetical protein
MKGVIATICPTATVIDLTHQIPPQDIAAAQFALLSAYPYFPVGTIHTVVVDPGVGTTRRAIALRTESGYLVGPDNGVLSGVIQHYRVIEAVALTNCQYWRSPHPSATFHGRDIFAPVAAYLATGVCFADLGQPLPRESLVRLDLPAPIQQPDGILIGQIQAIDHFGNLITTIPAAAVPLETSVTEARVTKVRVDVGSETMPLTNTYGAVSKGNLVAIIGSHGWLEVALNGGSAQTHCQAQVGDLVRLQRGG